MKSISDHINEAIKVTRGNASSGFSHATNDSEDFRNKLDQLAKDIAPKGVKSAKVISLASGTLQITYDTGDFVKLEKSTNSNKDRLVGKWNGVKVDTGWSVLDYTEGKYTAYVGARNKRSMSDSSVQRMFNLSKTIGVAESFIESLEIIHEAAELNKVTVYFRDDSKDGSDFAKFINYIGKNGNTGHSFDIVIDPDDKEHKKSFGWDGDGSCRIDKVELNDKAFKETL